MVLWMDASIVVVLSALASFIEGAAYDAAKLSGTPNDHDASVSTQSSFEYTVASIETVRARASAVSTLPARKGRESFIRCFFQKL